MNTQERQEILKYAPFRIGYSPSNGGIGGATYTAFFTESGWYVCILGNPATLTGPYSKEQAKKVAQKAAIESASD